MNSANKELNYIYEERQQEGLCWQAKIARHRFAHGKALSCCCSRYVYIYVYIYI